MKNLWERFRFYVAVFIMGTALPSYGGYLAAEKYADPKNSPICTVAVVIFVGAVIVITYVREQRARKAHEDSR
jgi:hypothetical protein